MKKQILDETKQHLTPRQLDNFLLQVANKELRELKKIVPSPVRAAQLTFNYIKTHGGLLDPAIGQRYISKIIGRGGSCDPSILIADFLQTTNSDRR